MEGSSSDVVMSPVGAASPCSTGSPNSPPPCSGHGHQASYGGPPVIMSPCAACKILRRRCADKCVLAPYFPPTDPLKFSIAHKVFGASNIIKLLQVIYFICFPNSGRFIKFFPLLLYFITFCYKFKFVEAI